MDAKALLTEIIDHFANSVDTPDSWWAHSDDGTAYCLDHSSGSIKFWIDLDKDGTITLLWKRGTENEPTVMKFVANGQIE